MENKKDREIYDALLKKCIKELFYLTPSQKNDKIFNWYNNREIPFNMVHELTRYIKHIE